MILGHSDSFFTRYTQPILFENIKDVDTIPFKYHPEFPKMVDVLARKETHHLILSTPFPINLHTSFLEAFLLYLRQPQIPKALRQTELMHMKLEREFYSYEKQKCFENDFLRFKQALDLQDKYVLLAMSNVEWLVNKSSAFQHIFLQEQFYILMNHPQCRLIILTHSTEPALSKNQNLFSFSNLPHLDEADIPILLKRQAQELEKFHHVSFESNVLPESYQLTQRYLNINETFKTCLLLLDTCAAKAHQLSTQEVRPKTITLENILQVIADWANIPLTHLLPAHVGFQHFVPDLQAKIFGQDNSIALIASEWQRSHFSLGQKPHPFGRFLFVGPRHTGKKTTVSYLADQLFQQRNVIFKVQPSSLKQKDFSNLVIKQYETQRAVTIKELLSMMPHAILLFEDIEKADPGLLESISEILSTGALYGLGNQHYDFRQTTFIFTTTLGCDSLTTLTNTCITDIHHHETDLMQLLADKKHHTRHTLSHYFSMEEVIETIMPDLTTGLPQQFCEQVHIIPFLPLNHDSIEKIIRTNVSKLSKECLVQHGIELIIAPEVIHHLISESMVYEEIKQGSNTIHSALKQLRDCLEQALLKAQTANLNFKQLYLQLNETGQILNWEWQNQAVG